MGQGQDWNREVQDRLPAPHRFDSAAGCILQCAGLGWGSRSPVVKGRGELGDKILIKSWTFLHHPPLQLTASHFSRGQALGENEDRNKLVMSRLISQETYSVVAKNR